jgi:hypothetical protein
MTTDHKGSGAHPERSPAGKFRRFVVAPASLILTILYVIFFVGEVREKFHLFEETHPDEPRPSLLQAMRSSVDQQLQQIRSVNARALGAALGNDLDTHDCSWRFQCKERPANYVFPPLTSVQPHGSRPLTPSTSIFTQKSSEPSQSQIHPLALSEHPTDLSHAFDQDDSSERKVHPPALSQSEINAILLRGKKNPLLNDQQSTPLLPLKKTAPTADDKAQPSSIEQLGDDQKNNASLVFQNHDESPIHSIKNPPHEAAASFQTPPQAVIHLGFVPIPTFHTIFGLPRALNFAVGEIKSAGGWAVVMFLACGLLYLLLTFAAARDAAPLFAFVMIMVAPIVITYMVQFVQYVAGGLFYGVSWVLGECVLLLAYAGGLGLLLALPHIYKAPREVIEAVEVIRNV